MADYDRCLACNIYLVGEGKSYYRLDSMNLHFCKACYDTIARAVRRNDEGAEYFCNCDPCPDCGKKKRPKRA